MDGEVLVSTQQLVSVIIPTHNRLASLKIAVQSVLRQTYQGFEIIIVDDGSKESVTLQALGIEDQRIRIFRHETPQGGSQARNRGIAESQGSWLAFLDDDDVWRPEKLDLQLRSCLRHPHAVACSAAYMVHYPLSITRKVMTPSHIPLGQLLIRNALGGASVCLCKSVVVKEMQGFNSTLRSAQDWDLWVRLRMRGDIVSVTTPLVDYMIHFNDRISNNMHSQYLGAKRFYFKHRRMMSRRIQLSHIRHICYIKSRNRQLPLTKRIKYLMIALKQTEGRQRWSYLLSSVPRMLTNRL